MKTASFEQQEDLWLSEVLGRPSYRLLLLESAKGTAKEELRRLLETQSFYYSKLETSDVEAVHEISSAGLLLVDTNLQFKKVLKKREASPKSSRIRFSEAKDRESVAVVAENAFTFSRFHLDPRIPKETANRVKAEWVRNYYRGERGEHMLVAEVDGETAGFLQLLQPTETELVIDLIAVAPKFQGQGLAGEMIAFAEAAFEGVEKILVGTQAANASSVRLYERLGFRLHSAKYVFHHWG